MPKTRTPQDLPTPEAEKKIEKKITRRQTIGVVGVLSAAGLSALKENAYAKAAIKASLRLEPEPGTPEEGT